MKNLRFEEVLKGLREGKRFARESWSESVEDNTTERLYNLDKIYIKTYRIIVDVIHYFQNGSDAAWVPTQDDIMENDWYEYSAYENQK